MRGGNVSLLLTRITSAAGGRLSPPAPPRPGALWPHPGRWAPPLAAVIGTQSHIRPAVAREVLGETCS